MKKLLMNDRLLFILPWIYAISTLALEVYGLLVNAAIYDIYELGMEIMDVVLVFGITISFKKHEKNIMKILFGAVMMQCVAFAFNYVVEAFVYEEGPHSQAHAVLYFVLWLSFFVNHLMLGFGHRAAPSKVSVNILVGLALIFFVATWNLGYDNAAENAFAVILGTGSEAAMVLEVLCVETRVDEYKSDREAAGWTEKTGYPEGYIHEYEKTVK